LLTHEERPADEEKDVKSVTRWIEANSKRTTAAALERLKEAPIERLDAEVACLLRLHGFAAVRSAFVELLEWAPLQDFPALRDVFRQRFAH
jgi:hypothetical protein